ncbi:GNAT family N-acetyltransferase [Pseudarthrobacter sp. C4D7]|uniref:GNAT family N-acetyltransferase n=1 Tax=Pseudarthrobacter sp. C4D7 TaxID=2735268 RepID=UPI0015857BF8|nr:GNAT family N-acetyltransferase [Pseudarthrobacter sp. C4D7]NUT71274.1 N-acetyltransferase [Pseudarthrobacter sp. C4D7]
MDRPVTIRPMCPTDWAAVHTIYAAGIATGEATFESEPPTWEAFDAVRLPEHRIVAEDAGRVLGWAAVSRVSSREVYRGLVEHSIYVDPAAQGRGVGRLLLAALIGSTEAAGIWTIQSSIFPGNTPSLVLHRKLGFRVVGTRERIARISNGPKAGHWQDTLLLERRSTVVGTE